MDNPDSQLQQWLSCELRTKDFSLAALPGDASFRTYIRVKAGDQSYIVMIAPTDKESTAEFVNIAKEWFAQGMQVPAILAFEQRAGFVLMSDFGDRLLLDLLNEDTAEFYYQSALDEIVHMQSIQCPSLNLPLYDEAFVNLELGYFREWFIDKLLNITLSAQEVSELAQVNHQIMAHFCTQPQYTVHRDYHSRNLMVLPSGALGIIDFQDAMIGPITYDLVSLLKDCYIAWPREQVIRWVKAFFEKLLAANKVNAGEFELFLQWFDWVGLQRHLKVLGIFSRLKLRDNKPHYLQHIPRIMEYIFTVTQQYSTLDYFDHFLQTKVLPRLVDLDKVEPTVRVA